MPGNDSRWHRYCGIKMRSIERLSMQLQSDRMNINSDLKAMIEEIANQPIDCPRRLQNQIKKLAELGSELVDYTDALHAEIDRLHEQLAKILDTHL